MGGGGRKATSSVSLKAEAEGNSDTGCTYFIHTGFELHRMKTPEVPLPLLCKDLTERKLSANISETKVQKSLLGRC